MSIAEEKIRKPFLAFQESLKVPNKILDLKDKRIEDKATELVNNYAKEFKGDTKSPAILQRFTDKGFDKDILQSKYFSTFLFVALEFKLLAKKLSLKLKLNIKSLRVDELAYKNNEIKVLNLFLESFKDKQDKINVIRDAKKLRI